MDDAKFVQCKRITVDRFLQATLYSIVAQIAPVTIFLLFVNINLFHPITWFLDTSRLVFSLYTWVYMCPLIIAVATHGIVWSKVFLSHTHYYPNRFILILNTCTKKAALLATHTLVGFCTAWIFVQILRWTQATGDLSPEGQWCLLISGMFMGSYHFIKSRLKLTQDVPFPLVQQRRFLRIRAHLYSILQSSFITALMPSLVYVSLTIVLMPFTIAQFHLDDHLTMAALFRNWKLLVYIWLLASQILSTMQFMEQLFIVLLTEHQPFAISHQGPNSPQQLTLADALNADHFKIIQELASLDLYSLGDGVNKQRRRELFSLSIPGGHPYNWRAVSEATMRNVSTFTKQLIAAIENVQSYEKSQSQSPTSTTTILSHQQRKIQSASQMAEKIMQRQMNENMGIRNMSHIYPGEETSAVVDRRAKILQRLPPPQDVQQGVENCLRTAKGKLLALPGINYFLAEQHYARVYYVLKQSQRIVWLLQGISTLASCSIREDEYGIVQKTLPAIVAQLLELKLVTDQVDAISMDRKRFKSHQKALRSAVKRSLYNIASTFGDYLNDLILPEADREALVAYVYYREN